MKKTTIKTAFGTLAIAGVLLMAPSVFADTASTSTGSFSISGNGVTHVKNAEVISISGNVITAITHVANLITNWTFTTNASTTLNASATSTAGIHVGDKLNVTGVLTSLGSTISVNATKIVDMATFALFKTKTGTVQSVNTSTGTFVLKTGDRLVTVQTTASTTFNVMQAGTSTVTTTTLAGLTVNSKVQVAGSLNADRTVLTASRVVVNPAKIERGEKHDTKENNGASHGLKNGQKEKEDRDNPGEHKGFLKVGLGVGIKSDITDR